MVVSARLMIPQYKSFKDIGKNATSYIIVAPKNAKISRKVLEVHRKYDYHYMPSVVPMEIVSRSYTVRYSLLILPRSSKKRKYSSHDRSYITENYVTLATNVNHNFEISEEHLVSLSISKATRKIRDWVVQMSDIEYRRRANIEVSYKIQEQFRG